MRSLMIFGGLAFCVLLVTASNGDRTEDGGGKMETMDSKPRRLVKQDDSKLPCCPRLVKKTKKCMRCPGSTIVIGRSFPGTTGTRYEQIKISDLREFWDHNEDEGTNGIAAGIPSEADQMALVRSRRDTSPPPKSGRVEGSRGRKKNGRKRQHKEKEEGKTRSRHHHHPEREKEEKIKRYSGAHSFITSSRYGGKKKELSDVMEKEGGKTRSRHHHHHHHEGEKEEKIKRRLGARSLITSSRYGGIKELGDEMEAAERTRRQSEHHSSKKVRKERKHNGSRSPIAEGTSAAKRN